MIERQGIKGVHHGANILGGEGSGSATHVVCERFNGGTYNLAEVDKKTGKMVAHEGLMLPFSITDESTGGVTVEQRVKRYNRRVLAGVPFTLAIGPHFVTIEGTHEKGIFLNGVPVREATQEIVDIRYGRTVAPVK